MTSARAQRRDRRGSGLNAAECIDADVDAAVGEVAQSGGDVVAGHPEDGRLCSQRQGRSQGRLVHVDRDHAGTQCRGDHDGGQAHAAAAEDGDDLARTDLRHLGDRAIRGGEAAAERGRGHVGDVGGQVDHVGVGEGDGDVLGERAGSMKARLPLVRAHLPAAGGAGRALAAGAHERHRDAVAHGTRLHARPRPRRRHPRTRGLACVAATAMSESCPCQPCQSLRHRPVARTAMTIPPGGAMGSGTSARWGIAPKSSYCTARMAGV